ncbi:DNA binding methylated-DNA--cysteine S-methyltransferase [Hypomontagnella monticulosa]|nr:DNA binding methylated-DNA--cysteine S-methyltransferase [Hypomontagnella monticulosa]
MARSDEAQAFFVAVYATVQQIPYGKVTSYGHIAKLVGTPQRPRQVGICLKHLPQDADSRFNHDNVPWQRPSGARNQAAALRAEGVTVTTDALGELMVDFSEYGWFPDELPSEGEEEE